MSNVKSFEKPSQLAEVIGATSNGVQHHCYHKEQGLVADDTLYLGKWEIWRTKQGGKTYDYHLDLAASHTGEIDFDDGMPLRKLSKLMGVTENVVSSFFIRESIDAGEWAICEPRIGGAFLIKREHRYENSRNYLYYIDLEQSEFPDSDVSSTGEQEKDSPDRKRAPAPEPVVYVPDTDAEIVSLSERANPPSMPDVRDSGGEHNRTKSPLPAMFAIAAAMALVVLIGYLL